MTLIPANIPKNIYYQHNHSASTSSNSAASSSIESHIFVFYQLTTVGVSDAPISTLVPVPISAAPYRKALIAKIF